MLTFGKMEKAGPQHATYFRPFAFGRYSSELKGAHKAERFHGGEVVKFTPADEDAPVVVAFHAKHLPRGGIGRKESVQGRHLRRAHQVAKQAVAEHGDRVVFTGRGDGGRVAELMGGVHKVSHIRYYQRGGGAGGQSYGGSFLGSIGHFFKKVGHGIGKVAKGAWKGFKKVSHVVSKIAKPFLGVIKKIPLVGQAIEMGEKLGLDPLDFAANIEKIVKKGKDIAGKIYSFFRNVGVHNKEKVDEVTQQLVQAHDEVHDDPSQHHEPTHHLVQHIDVY